MRSVASRASVAVVRVDEWRPKRPKTSQHAADAFGSRHGAWTLARRRRARERVDAWVFVVVVVVHLARETRTETPTTR